MVLHRLWRLYSPWRAMCTRPNCFKKPMSPGMKIRASPKFLVATRTRIEGKYYFEDQCSRASCLRSNSREGAQPRRAVCLSFCTSTELCTGSIYKQMYTYWQYGPTQLSLRGMQGWVHGPWSKGLSTYICVPVVQKDSFSCCTGLGAHVNEP